jgi:hypothetical protein
MEAAENNHLDAVKYLIKAGAQVDPKVPTQSGSYSYFMCRCFLDEEGAVSPWNTAGTCCQQDICPVV